MRRPLEAAGIEFIDDNGGGAGVRLRKRQRKKSPNNRPVSFGGSLKRKQRFEPRPHFVKHATRSFTYKTRSSLLP
jgi:hypothetical protein